MLLLLPRAQVQAGGLRALLQERWAAAPAARGFGELLRARDLPLLAARRAGGLLGGLWELPVLEEGAAGAFCAEYGVELLGGPAAELRHAYSHFRESLAPLPGLLESERRLASWSGQRWVPAAGWGGLPRTHQTVQALRRLGLEEGT
jgi:adenine-specific DNA glycosylase